MVNGARGTGDIEITVTGDYYGYIPKYKTDGTTDTNHPVTIQVTSSESDYPDLRVKPNSLDVEQPATLSSGTQNVRVGWDDENIGLAPVSDNYTDSILVQKVSDSGGSHEYHFGQHQRRRQHRGQRLQPSDVLLQPARRRRRRRHDPRHRHRQR